MKKYEKYLGVPYKHLGRDMNGLDCWGLPIMYYKDILNVELKDWWYEPDWSKKGENYFLEKYKEFHFEKVETPKRHDIVLMCMDISSWIPSHAAVVIEPPNMAITAGKHGVHKMDLNSNIVKRRIEGFYRLCQD